MFSQCAKLFLYFKLPLTFKKNYKRKGRKRSLLKFTLVKKPRNPGSVEFLLGVCPHLKYVLFYWIYNSIKTQRFFYYTFFQWLVSLSKCLPVRRHSEFYLCNSSHPQHRPQLETTRNNISEETSDSDVVCVQHLQRFQITWDKKNPSHTLSKRCTSTWMSAWLRWRKMLQNCPFLLAFPLIRRWRNIHNLVLAVWFFKFKKQNLKA